MQQGQEQVPQESGQEEEEEGGEQPQQSGAVSEGAGMDGASGAEAEGEEAEEAEEQEEHAGVDDPKECCVHRGKRRVLPLACTLPAARQRARLKWACTPSGPACTHARSTHATPRTRTRAVPGACTVHVFNMPELLAGDLDSTAA